MFASLARAGIRPLFNHPSAFGVHPSSGDVQGGFETRPYAPIPLFSNRVIMRNEGADLNQLAGA